MNSDEDRADARGFPIRRFTDQSLFAAPRNISQRTTSFIASRCQGIHQTPLSRLIVLISNVHPHTDDTAEKTSFILKTCPDDDAVRHHGLGEWLPPSGKPLRSLETNPFFTMSMSWPRFAAGQFICGRDRYRLLRSTPNGEVVEPDGIEPTTSSLQS